MKTTKWMASLAVGTALVGPTLSVNAQYVQNAITTPIAPGCGPGESWTKNGARYQCETPQPSCQYGFASGPVWTGSSWSFSCNAPPPPVQPTPATGGNTQTVTRQDEENACTAAYTAFWRKAPIGGASAMTGPYTGSGLNQFNNSVAAIAATGVYLSTAAPEVQTGNPGTPANSNDMFIFQNGAYCWLQPGTTNVTGLALLTWCSPNGGSVQCGGGGVGN